VIIRYCTIVLQYVQKNWIGINKRFHNSRSTKVYFTKNVSKKPLKSYERKENFFKDDIISRKVIIPRGYFRDDCKYSHDEVSFIDGLFDINDTLSLSAYHKGQNNDRLSVIGINEQEYDTILLHSSMLTNDEYFTEDGLMNWQIRVQRNITSGYHSGNR